MPQGKHTWPSISLLITEHSTGMKPVILNIMGRLYWHQGLFMRCLHLNSELFSDQQMTELRPRSAVMRLFLPPAPNYSSLLTHWGCNNASVTQSCHDPPVSHAPSVITPLHHVRPFNVSTCMLSLLFWLSGDIVFNLLKESSREVWADCETVTVATAEQIWWLFNEKNFPFHLLPGVVSGGWPQSFSWTLVPSRDQTQATFTK